VAILSELQREPQSLMKHLQDERVQLLLQELMRLNNPEAFKQREAEELARSPARLAATLPCQACPPCLARAPARLAATLPATLSLKHAAPAPARARRRR
jgi:hypothetical protein